MSSSLENNQAGSVLQLCPAVKGRCYQWTGLAILLCDLCDLQWIGKCEKFCLSPGLLILVFKIRSVIVLMILAFPLFHFTDNPHCDPKPHAMLGEHSWLYYAISCQKMLTSSLVMESSETDLTAYVARLAIPYTFCKHMTHNSSNISYSEILDCCKVVTPDSLLCFRHWWIFESFS